MVSIQEQVMMACVWYIYAYRQPQNCHFHNSKSTSIQKALSILEMHLRFDNVNSKIKWPQSKVGGAQLALAVDIFHKWGTI